MSDVYSVSLDPNGVVLAWGTNAGNPTVVDAATYQAIAAKGGLCKLVNGEVVDYTPPAGPAPTPTVTGNQWAFALSSLGLSAAWQVGVTKSKASDQVRIGLIARDTPLLAADPLLARVAANAGNDASSNPLIVVTTVFAAAQGMPQ